jgi:hypothetical protein
MEKELPERMLLDEEHPIGDPSRETGSSVQKRIPHLLGGRRQSGTRLGSTQLSALILERPGFLIIRKQG